MRSNPHNTMLALPDYRRHDPCLSSCFLYGNVSKPTHYGVHLAMGQRSNVQVQPYYCCNGDVSNVELPQRMVSTGAIASNLLGV